MENMLDAHKVKAFQISCEWISTKLPGLENYVIDIPI
jgi:hypothetical protein